MKAVKFLIFSTLLLSLSCYAQLDPFEVENNEFNVGSDIFNDFNEDIESAKVMEDERFYRYGRFFSFSFGLNVTTFSGNRGAAYKDDLPGYSLGFLYFSGFFKAFGLGLSFSGHRIDLPDNVNGYRENAPFVVDISMLRVYFSYRYYINTADLGTALTYANPYLIGRLEYWYTTNKVSDSDQNQGSSDIIDRDDGGGIGTGIGFGLEFPIKIRESYINLEGLIHFVSFHDKNTNNYQKVGDGIGYDDLTGNAYTLTLSYVVSW